MNTQPLLIAAILALLAAPTLFAHHGTAGTYDSRKVLKVSGTVKAFYWRNPHCALVLTGKDESGKEVTYAFEIAGPGGLAREGWSKQTFKPGDTVSLEMHPAYGNPNVGQPVRSTIVLNGKRLSGGSTGDPE
jgi:hypothetical protein